jgi:hypothetical protein
MEATAAVLEFDRVMKAGHAVDEDADDAARDRLRLALEQAREVFQ